MLSRNASANSGALSGIFFPTEVARRKMILLRFIFFASHQKQEKLLRLDNFSGSSLGHVPRFLSKITTYLLKAGGKMEATVTGTRQNMRQNGKSRVNTC